MFVRRRLFVACVVVLYACALLQFTRYYARSTSFYLKMPAYLNGHERLPFQERVLPMMLMRLMYHSHSVMSLLVHPGGIVTVDRGPFYLISLVGLTVAAILTQVIYNRISRRRTLGILVFPVFLFTVMWTYSIHSEANFSYPYDMLSLAFFTAGLLFIYERRFVPLLLIVLVGTINRETTMFLIGIYVLDAASVAGRLGVAAAAGSLRDRFDVRQVPWWRVCLLGSIWLALKFTLAYHFRWNDASENFVRFRYNAHLMTLRMMPALLNVCGYTLPLVWLLWARIRPQRFGNYVWILVLWLPVMFWTGVLVETRIYGELCSYTAVALVLLTEEYAAVPERALPEVQQMHVAGASRM